LRTKACLPCASTFLGCLSALRLFLGYAHAGNCFVHLSDRDNTVLQLTLIIKTYMYKCVITLGTCCHSISAGIGGREDVSPARTDPQRTVSTASLRHHIQTTWYLPCYAYTATQHSGRLDGATCWLHSHPRHAMIPVRR